MKDKIGCFFYWFKLLCARDLVIYLGNPIHRSTNVYVPELKGCETQFECSM